MNSVSPDKLSKRPAFQSAFAISIRSFELDTKFHQICRGPSIGSPPNNIRRAPLFRASSTTVSPGLNISRWPVWYEGVEENLKKYEPDVVILNSGDAQVLGYEPIIMDKKDVYEVYKAAPKATIIASHMESVNHAMLSRKELREFLSEKGMTQRVLVPEDGETCVF